MNRVRLWLSVIEDHERTLVREGYFRFVRCKLRIMAPGTLASVLMRGKSLFFNYVCIVLQMAISLRENGPKNMFLPNVQRSDDSASEEEDATDSREFQATGALESDCEVSDSDVGLLPSQVNDPQPSTSSGRGAYLFWSNH